MLEIECLFREYAQIPFQLCRQQYALHLAFCMSINKSQGQSLQHVGLDFRSPGTVLCCYFTCYLCT